VDPENKTPTTKVAFGIAQRFASLALPLGFSVGEFIAVSKEAFIEAATSTIKKRGIRPTTSRIAVITGLTRAEVARIRDGTAPPPVAVSEPRTERVMNAWFTDPEFLDPDGVPRVLQEFGNSSFESLVRKYSGDMPRRALLEELIAGGMAEREPNDLIRAIRRHHHTSSAENLNLEQLGMQVNFATGECERGTVKTLTVEFDGALPIAVQRTVNQRTERFLEALSDYLHAEARKGDIHSSTEPVNFHLMISHRESNTNQSK
jgi:hypothetical protein